MSNQQAHTFSVEGVRISQQDKITMIDIENKFARAKITTHGGCVLSFTPNNAQDLLWVSPTAIYNGEKPVRGGVPVCWPWFGAHPTDSSAPAHGFVRNAVWQLDSVEKLASGVTQVVLSFGSSAETLAIWPYEFHLDLKVTVAETLYLELTTTNLSEQEMLITEAFHTYFNVDNADGLNILGLDGSRHLDKLTHAPEVVQAGTIVLQPPMDSVYLDHTTDAVIEDAGNQRQIKIAKHASASSVVWNPGAEIVKGFGDIPDELWTKFVCVEAGNIFDNAVPIASGQKHSLMMQLANVPA